MPKDYQTSQYDKPITIDGWLEVDGERIGITRAHLEEDTGKSHARRWRRPHPRRRLLARRLQPRRRAAARDRVRARHPLGRAGEALRRGAPGDAARDRRLRREDGRRLAAHRRQRVGAAGRSRRVRHAVRDQEPELAAVAGEGDRARGAAPEAPACEFGDAIVQETRHWDEARGRTIAGRSKEEAHDYRYFPEPDLVPVAPTDEMRAHVRATMPELPAARRARADRRVGDQGRRRARARRRPGPRRLRREGGRRAERRRRRRTSSTGCARTCSPT